LLDLPFQVVLTCRPQRAGRIPLAVTESGPEPTSQRKRLQVGSVDFASRKVGCRSGEADGEPRREGIGDHAVGQGGLDQTIEERPMCTLNLL
jgi:hypothetical protein